MNTSLTVIATLLTFAMMFFAFQSAKKNEMKGKYFLNLTLLLLLTFSLMYLSFKQPDVVLIEYCIMVVPGLYALLLFLYFMMVGLKKKE